VAEPIVMSQLEGASGALSHSLTSSDVLYDGLPVDGIDLTVAQGAVGAVVITETGGNSVVEEGALANPLSVDSYGVRLAVAPAAGTKVYVTVSGSRSQRDEETGLPNGESLLVRSATSAFTHEIELNGSATTVRDRAVVLVFDSTNWDDDQTVFVHGFDDLRPEGERTVTVNHAVAADVIAPAATGSAEAGAQAATIATFNQAKVRNVEVRIIDNDQPGLTVTENNGGTLVLEGSLAQDVDGHSPGIADSFRLKLAKELTTGQTVTVTLAADAARLGLSQTTVEFDEFNWDIGVNITVTAADDAVREDFKRSFTDMTTSSAVAGYNGLAS
jgi:hypothetical protein